MKEVLLMCAAHLFPFLLGGAALIALDLLLGALCVLRSMHMGRR